MWHFNCREVDNSITITTQQLLWTETETEHWLIDWSLNRQIWPHNTNTWSASPKCKTSITTKLQQIRLQFNSCMLTRTWNPPLLWIFSFLGLSWKYPLQTVHSFHFHNSKQQIRFLRCLDEVHSCMNEQFSILGTGGKEKAKCNWPKQTWLQCLLSGASSQGKSLWSRMFFGESWRKTQKMM